MPESAKGIMVAGTVVALLGKDSFLTSFKDFCTGPLVAPMGGADISWIIGLAVPALLYWLLARRNTAHIPGNTAAGSGGIPQSDTGVDPTAKAAPAP